MAAAPRRNGVSVRAFMASTAASEAMQDKRVPGEYTAANVQVIVAAISRPPSSHVESLRFFFLAAQAAL